MCFQKLRKVKHLFFRCKGGGGILTQNIIRGGRFVKRRWHLAEIKEIWEERGKRQEEKGEVSF